MGVYHVLLGAVIHGAILTPNTQTHIPVVFLITFRYPKQNPKPEHLVHYYKFMYYNIIYLDYYITYLMIVLSLAPTPPSPPFSLAEG